MEGIVARRESGELGQLLTMPLAASRTILDRRAIAALRADLASEASVFVGSWHPVIIGISLGFGVCYRVLRFYFGSKIQLKKNIGMTFSVGDLLDSTAPW